MSRYCIERIVEPILHAAQHWKEVGLLSDGSIFDGDATWTLQNLEALNQGLAKQPDERARGFYEKLWVQLGPTTSGVVQLVAEMLWLMFLCPCNIGKLKKRESIESIWECSGKTFPEGSEWIRDDVLSGVGSTGIGFNANRWRELVFFCHAMIAFQRLTDQERNELLSDGWRFAKWLGKVPGCDARQLRHMLLFLLFPDDFERIFSKTDREEIVHAFTEKPEAEIKRLSALEIDQSLRNIREHQEEKYGTKELDFYANPLRDRWRDSRPKTWPGARAWLLSWNPSNWKWVSLAADRAASHKGETVTRKCVCVNEDASVGDKAFLLRAGEPPKGIIAIGKISRIPLRHLIGTAAKVEHAST